MTDKLQVIAGLIFNDRGEVLIAQRQSGKWEFPGGKLEKNEDHISCLVRELREELGIDVMVGDRFAEVSHDYPTFSVELTLYNIESFDGKPLSIVHRSIKWVPVDQLTDYDFLEADEPLIARLYRISKQGPH